MSGREPRNDRLVDLWSLAHLASGIVLGWALAPQWALSILILWEPLEVLVLSPLSYRWFGKEFGRESIRNIAGDLVVDVAGWAVGFYALRGLLATPWG